MASALTVSAFAETTGTNTSTQTASNVAVVTQTAAGVSGDAKATNFASASSGSVWVDTTAVQQQGNLQAVVNAAVPVLSPSSSATATNTSTQSAANGALAVQAGVGVSGDAKATNNASARSGRVSVDAFAKQAQGNAQVIANLAVPVLSSKPVTSTNTATQTADALACLDQSAIGASGYAEATDHASAWTGYSHTDVTTIQKQGNLQIVVNLNGRLLW